MAPDGSARVSAPSAEADVLDLLKQLVKADRALTAALRRWGR